MRGPISLDATRGAASLSPLGLTDLNIFQKGKLVARSRYPRVSGSTAAKAQSRAAFVATGGVSLVPAKALTFSNGEPLQFTDGSYLEFIA